MNIIHKSRELTKIETYKMTKGKDALSVKDVEDGEMLEVDACLLYEETNSKGETVNILSVLGKDGTVWACQSQTFKDDFFDIVDIFADEIDANNGHYDFTIKKISGESKAGRMFVGCALVG